MKEIGGYIEIEQNRGPLLHDKAIALNSGRSCLAYLIRAKQIKRIALPYFLCDSVINICKKEGADISFYHIDRNFLPIDLRIRDGEWLYLVNYYGQLLNEQIEGYAKRYPNIIVDYAQAYFQTPLEGVDSIYTCRKFFGVADGGFLYTNTLLHETIAQDESFERMRFLLGRYERTANEFYSEYSANNHIFSEEPTKRMSKLTDNLLRGIDYDFVKKRRTENFEYLQDALCTKNGLDIKLALGAYMYPFYTESGSKARKQLQAERIYIPTLWPNVKKVCPDSSREYQMAENILPLPVDQRYTLEDMKYLLEKVMKCID